MVSGLGDGIDPAVIGCFQVVLDFGTAEGDDIELVLEGIEGEEVVEYQGPFAHGAVVGEGCGNGKLGRIAGDGDGVDEVDVIRHAGIGVTRPQGHVEHAHFPQGEFPHGLKLLPEGLAHHRIGLFCLHRNQVRLEGLAHNHTAFHLQVHLSMGYEAAVAAGVQQGRLLPRLHIGFVVMAADEPVHAFHGVEGIQGLAFQDGAVSLAAAGVHGHHHHVGLLLGLHQVHIPLDVGLDALEVHAAPYFLGQPGLDVGVVITDYGNLEAGLVHHFI